MDMEMHPLYEIETQFIEDVSGEHHYKFKGGRSIAVSCVNSEAQAIAAASLWLSENSDYLEVLLPSTATPKDHDFFMSDVRFRQSYAMRKLANPDDLVSVIAWVEK
jgi:hypothetical protein